jgi:NAD(P)-dependent dehydrogenase (short-subunit alcohol dehydrogenase family)
MREAGSHARADSLAGRVAIVTGSSSGIGSAIALELAAAGAAVVVNSRSRDRAAPVAARIESAGGRAIAVAADVCDPAQVSALVREAVGELGGLDILVNNAGAGFVAASEELSEDDWRRVIEVDLTAPFLCAQASARHMLAVGRGVIVNIASTLGHTAMPGRAAYAAAKHGLIGLTKVLGSEWGRRGVRCVAVSPGYVATELVRENMRRGGFDERDIERRTPLGRMATPQEVARVVAFVASDAASYMTATHVLVDGGWVGYGGF